MRSLRIDRVSAEVVGALRSAGIASLLLKGPVLARRLYRDGASRPYVDCDLLVERRRLADAEIVLAGQGFVQTGGFDDWFPGWAQHAHSWERSRDADPIAVDLHWTLMHVGVAPQALWDALTRGSQTLQLSGVAVDAPGDPQLSLHAALHVAEHGAAQSPAEDLARALERFPFETWIAASELARELDAERAFAAGLRLLAPGRELADRLGLDRGGVETFALERLAREPGLRGKARLAIGIVAPAPQYMRSFNRPLAGRGALGLLAAYAWRPIDLLIRTARALIAPRLVRRPSDAGR